MNRLRIAYLVPGHHLVPTAGPTRNVLSLAQALSAHADVTVAFRRAVERPDGASFEVHELDPGPAPQNPVDDAAVRGTSVSDLRAYLRALRAYADDHDFDVVLEKTWLLSGYLCRAFRSRGTPGAVIENQVRVWKGGMGSWSAMRGFARHHLVRAAVRRLLPRADHVIAETEPLKDSLVRRLGVRPEGITVVGLGLDHDRFRPADREAARRALDLAQDTRVLLYFGVLDATHDLSAVLAAARDASVPGLELHVLGDGTLRSSYEERFCGAPVRFHGRVPHERIPAFIAASDLCLAPYDPGAFPDGELEYFTLKIPEAMACARPVASVPGRQTRALIEDGVSGFLVENTQEAWGALLAALPPREELDRMGARSAERAASITWEETARGYFEVCQRLARVFDGPRAD